MSKFFTVKWIDVRDALAVGVVVFLLTAIIEVIAAKSIYGLDWKTILNNAVIGALSVVGSFLKSLLTTSKGTLAGIKIK